MRYCYCLLPGLLVAAPLGNAAGLLTTPSSASCSRVSSQSAASKSELGTRSATLGITYFAGRSKTGDDAHLASALTTALAAELRHAVLVPGEKARGRDSEHPLTVLLSSSGMFADVDFALTGTVVRNERGLTTTVRVTRTLDGGVVWSTTSAGALREIPGLARQVAQGVTAHIGARLTALPVGPANAAMSDGVYELLLRGVDAGAGYDPAGLSRAIDFLDSASRLAPKSGELVRARERAVVQLLTWGGIGAPREHEFAEHGLFAKVNDRVRGESEILVDQADRLIREKQFAPACALLDRAIAADPRSIPAFALRALSRVRDGKVRDAYADAETVTQLGRPLWGNALRAIVLQKAGDVASAKRQLTSVLAMTRAVETSPSSWDARFVAIALADAGRREEARQLLSRVDRRDPRREALLRDAHMLGADTTPRA